MENTNDIPNEEQTGRLQQPAVMPRLLTFQVQQFDDATSGSWDYFEAPEGTGIEVLRQMAVECVKASWQKVLDGPKKLFGIPHRPCRPTVHVAEYANGKKVRGGIRFTTRWR